MNEGQYCLVNIPTADTVLEGPRVLPQNHYDNIHMNIRNEVNYPDSRLLALGWYPYVENDAGPPGQYYDRQLSGFTINPTNVSRDVIYTQWDISRVRESKNFELEIQLVEYSVNEQALNPSVLEYVRDDAEWLAIEQSNLARITDWNAAAAFDTTKPSVLALPNSYVGEKNVRQGNALTKENQAAAETGATVKWDQPTINSFVVANQTAADDPSNSTSPQMPNYKIRQGVGVVSEQFRRIIVWRFDVEGEADPNLDRSMAMRIFNRQDTRDLFTFIYTNAGSTYLGWKKFVKVNGNWEWKLEKDTGGGQGDGSIMTWTDSDIAFILSYSNNPAVEADWFTSPIQFPAGVEQRNILVAWDPEVQAQSRGRGR